MPLPAAPSNPPAGDNRKIQAAPVPAFDPGLDERMHDFWKRNGSAILWFCGLVLLGYLAKAGWEYWAGEREAGTEQEFAAASSPEKLKSFVSAHPDHVLSGIAELQLADAAYASGRSADAVGAYGIASMVLKSGPLASRAKLGLAMAKVQAGQTADGEASLRALADDVHQYKAVRSEATYQLASLAASAGRTDEVKRLALQLVQIDPNSPWTQRAFILQASLPAAIAGAPSTGKPAVSFKPGTP